MGCLFFAFFSFYIMEKAGKGRTVTITAKSTDGTNKKASVKMYRPQKVRPKNLTIGGRYFYARMEECYAYIRHFKSGILKKYDLNMCKVT